MQSLSYALPRSTSSSPRRTLAGASNRKATDVNGLVVWLQVICQLEKERESESVSRRFTHYLCRSGLPLEKPDICAILDSAELSRPLAPVLPSVVGEMDF